MQAAVTTVGGVVFLIVAGVSAENIGALGVGVWRGRRRSGRPGRLRRRARAARKAAAVVTPLSSPRETRDPASVPEENA